MSSYLIVEEPNMSSFIVCNKPPKNLVYRFYMWLNWKLHLKDEKTVQSESETEESVLRPPCNLSQNTYTKKKQRKKKRKGLGLVQ